MNRSRLFFSRWQNWLGLILVILFAGLAITAPLFSPQDPGNPGPIKVTGDPLDYTPRPPTAQSPLGTLSLGVSVFHSIVWGARSALLCGLIIALFSFFLGILIGTVSAYQGGFLNDVLMKLTDTFLSFPLIAGIVLISQLFADILNKAYITYLHAGFSNVILTPQNLSKLPNWVIQFSKIDPVVIALFLFSWMPYARLINTTVKRLKNTEYIEAARSLGVRPSQIVFRHLLPNAITPAVVMAAKDVGGIVVLQATFTFIGMGNSSPWGMLLVTGRDWIISPGGIFTYWWVFVPPTVALILFGIAWNLLGDGLNDALNPRSLL